MDEIDDEAVTAREGERAPRRRARAPKRQSQEKAAAEKAGSSPRPISVAPAQGSSGRQSSVEGGSVPKPSHNRARGLKTALWTTRGAAIAAAPARSAAPWRRAEQRRGEKARRRDAMQNAEPDRFVRRREIRAQGHQRRRGGNFQQAKEESTPSRAESMRNGERYARETEKRDLPRCARKCASPGENGRAAGASPK